MAANGVRRESGLWPPIQAPEIPSFSLCPRSRIPSRITHVVVCPFWVVCLNLHTMLRRPGP
jgi:hypothetical protein